MDTQRSTFQSLDLEDETSVKQTFCSVCLHLHSHSLHSHSFLASRFQLVLSVRLHVLGPVVLQVVRQFLFQTVGHLFLLIGCQASARLRLWKTHSTMQTPSNAEYVPSECCNLAISPTPSCCNCFVQRLQSSSQMAITRRPFREDPRVRPIPTRCTAT